MATEKNTKMINKLSSRRALILIVCNMLAGIIWAKPYLEILLFPVPDEGILNYGSIPLAYFYLSINAVFLISGLAILLGKNIAKIFFICSLSFITAFIINENILTIYYVINSDIKINATIFQSILAWWGLSSGIRWTLWLAFNCWYFFKIHEGRLL